MSFPNEPKAVRRFAGVVTMGLCAIAAWLAYQAVSCELTGKAKYPGGHGSRIVTRELSPSEFRQGTNSLWAASAFSIVTTAISFTFYRRLSSYP